MRYTAIKTWRGYEIRDNLRRMHLERVYKGEYFWVSDYLYAYKYSEKTMQKHLLRLNGKEK